MSIQEPQLKPAPSIGANRGIGLQLIRTFKENGWCTIGSVRPQTKLENDPSISEVATPREAIGAIFSSQNPQLIDTESEIIEIDYAKESTIVAAAKKLDGTKLDVLVNCAGKLP